MAGLARLPHSERPSLGTPHAAAGASTTAPGRACRPDGPRPPAAGMPRQPGKPLCHHLQGKGGIPMRLRMTAFSRRLALAAALVLGMTAAAAGVALALETPGGASSSETIVTVSAHGRVTLAPTRAIVETAVEGTGETPAKAEESMRLAYAHLRESLTALGFEL